MNLDLSFENDENILNDLENNQNRIHENELYDQNNGKPSNVNERSFIFINQKFMSPVMKQFHNPDILTDTISLIGKEKTINHYLEDDSVTYLNSKNVLLPEKVKESDRSRQSSYFPDEIPDDLGVVPHRFAKTNVHNDGSSAVFKNNANLKTLQFVELLKPPIILHTSNTPTIIPNNITPWQKQQVIPIHYDQYQKDINEMSFIPKSPMNPIKYKSDSYRLYRTYGQTSSKPEEDRQFPYVNNQQSDYNNEIIVPEERNVIIKKIMNDNDAMSKFLDKYIKKSLVKSVLYERLNEKVPCNYSECVSKSKIQYTNHHTNRNDCGCGHRFNVTLRESNGLRNYNMTKNSRMTTDSKSLEVGDYSDVMTDDTNIEK
ncbi:unnamed protein product [Diatraea saccharalis]|uniref:Uncharacterized protein n=1 Tax=Diatraea saccharalis TaxID=40085 RepID=A0A9N9WCL7_9NEOP|nr:unnamed protein product [Diatraea saccharalis]